PSPGALAIRGWMRGYPRGHVRAVYRARRGRLSGLYLIRRAGKPRRRAPAPEAMFGGRLGSPRGRQPILGDLVEHRLVADPEKPRRQGPIPVDPFEYLDQGVALGLRRGPTRDLAQALGPLGHGPNDPRPVAAASDERFEGLLTVVEDHHATDDVLELSDIAPPRVLGEARQGLRRKLLLPLVLPVEAGQQQRDQAGNLLPPLPERGDPESP